MSGEWPHEKLKQVVSIAKGRIVANSSDVSSASIPYIGAAAFEGVASSWTTSKNGVAAKPNDVLMLWDGERSGLVATNLEGVISSTVARLRPNPGWESRYLAHFLKSRFEFIQSRRTGTGVPHVPKDLGDILEVPRPPLPEQRRIAAILDTLDRTIEGTQRVIEKLQATRQGLLHDLLTRGLDENGRLRDPERNPEQFKETDLGRVPRGWEAARLAEVATLITDGTHQAVKTVDFGIPFLYVSNVRNGRILWEKSGFIAPSEYRVVSRGRQPTRDGILYTVVGSYGHAARISKEIDFSFQRHIAYIQPEVKRVDSHFLSIWLESPHIKRYADAVALGNAQRTVTLTELRKYPIQLPPLTEQKRVVEYVESFDRQVDLEQAQIAKLQALKQGLMEDLLTGQVRVAVATAEV
ncbi:restriction endonuclease S subunit [Deinococcus aerius]|uniref:Restriction endonuclease S subunit n=1 Tax=Deinococcus aerius TaxID=200253 RepID=A0A2I9DA89_9DEIO|nr:restriction endonuclease subunit S [Deinococcus aerius]GBF07540.1 restriction endonuclease S subunit [Deinococcus aerius]